jgi:alpha/beta superfamily hydrolase
MMPEPTCQFTIPSIQDDVQLECRIFHPKPTKGLQSHGANPQRKGAIIAHPYAPMGGCFDDHVIQAAGSELLKQGYILGTFNFR